MLPRKSARILSRSRSAARAGAGVVRGDTRTMGWRDGLDPWLHGSDWPARRRVRRSRIEPSSDRECLWISLRFEPSRRAADSIGGRVSDPLVLQPAIGERRAVGLLRDHRRSATALITALARPWQTQ